MTTQGAKKSQTMNQRLRRNFLLIIGISVVFGVVMLTLVLWACEFTPKLLRENYSSIIAVTAMREAWHNLPRENSDFWQKEFEKNLSTELSIADEDGEPEIAEHLRRVWNKIKGQLPEVSPSDRNTVESLLKELVQINESAMYRIKEESRLYKRKAVSVGLLFFTLMTVLSLTLSRKMARTLSKPLEANSKTLAELPDVQEKLKLEDSDTWEIDILNQSLRGLWDHLYKLKQIDLKILSLQRKELISILACVEDALLVLDNDGKILHFNEGLSQILQIPTKTLPGQVWKKLTTSSKNYEAIQDLIPGQIVKLDVAGQEKFYTIRKRDIVDEHGPLGEVFLFRDITEKSQNERLKREMVGVLSHELNTPLQSLSLALEILEKEKSSFSKSNRFLFDTLLEDAQRIRRIADQFFQVSTGEMQSLKFNFENVCLYETVKNSVQTFQLNAAEKGIKIVFTGNRLGVGLAKLDRTKFPWVISNLLSNAIRVSAPGQNIFLNLVHDEQNFTLTIRDEGPGIPEHFQAKIFQPYFQIQDADHPKGLFGLGLTITQQLVNAHGGAIQCYAGAPAGSVFEVTLPVHGGQQTVELS